MRVSIPDATAPIPTIFEGVPLRLRGLNIVIDAHNFLFNPTNCGSLSTDTVLSSTLGGALTLSGIARPFAASTVVRGRRRALGQPQRQPRTRENRR